jgi:hypothetical protein
MNNTVLPIAFTNFAELSLAHFLFSEAAVFFHFVNHKFARPQPPSCCVGLAELLVRLYFSTQGFKDVKESIHQETVDVRGRKGNQAVPWNFVPGSK